MVGKYVYPHLRLKGYFGGCVPAHTAYHAAAIYHAKEHRAAESFSSFREVYFTFSDWEATLTWISHYQCFLVRTFKYTKKLKELYSKHPYMYHINYTITSLLYLLVRVFFLYHWSAWDNSHAIYNFSGEITNTTGSAIIFKVWSISISNA